MEDNRILEKRQFMQRMKITAKLSWWKGNSQFNFYLLAEKAPVIISLNFPSNFQFLPQLALNSFPCGLAAMTRAARQQWLQFPWPHSLSTSQGCISMDVFKWELKKQHSEDWLTIKLIRKLTMYFYKHWDTHVY